MGFGVKRLRFRLWGLLFGVEGMGFGVRGGVRGLVLYGLGPRVYDVGSRVEV